MTLKEYEDFIKGKKVSVIGIGVSNMPLIRFLTKFGACVTARDKKEREAIAEKAAELESMGVTLVCGEKYLDGISDDIIFKTPGMRPDNPYLLEAAEKGSVLTSEMELFFELCPCRIFAVTGSDGKTTTTTLIYNILKQAGYTCYLGGNIGRPLIGDIEKIKESDMAVLELSSFQLFSMKKSANTAVVTNLSPNHLDWHKNMAEYEEAKKNVYKFQNENDTLIVNYDNEITRRMYGEAKGKAVYFSRKEKIGVYAADGIVRDENGAEIMKVSDIKLPGNHNLENYLAAAAATKDFVSYDDIKEVARNFSGVEHRIELFREFNGIKFYNDSIASSPTRTLAALNSFSQKLIMISGGYDKKIPFDTIGKPVQEKVKELVLVGATAEKIKTAIENAGSDTHITVCRSFEEAVQTAYGYAKEGDIVILSPMCASFDLFDNFMQRGNRFKELVNRLG